MRSVAPVASIEAYLGRGYCTIDHITRSVKMESIGNDILIHILSFLDDASLLSCIHVSRRWSYFGRALSPVFHGDNSRVLEYCSKDRYILVRYAIGTGWNQVDVGARLALRYGSRNVLNTLLHIIHSEKLILKVAAFVGDYGLMRRKMEVYPGPKYLIHAYRGKRIDLNRAMMDIFPADDFRLGEMIRRFMVSDSAPEEIESYQIYPPTTACPKKLRIPLNEDQLLQPDTYRYSIRRIKLGEYDLKLACRYRRIETIRRILENEFESRDTNDEYGGNAHECLAELARYARQLREYTTEFSLEEWFPRLVSPELKDRFAKDNNFRWIIFSAYRGGDRETIEWVSRNLGENLSYQFSGACRGAQMELAKVEYAKILATRDPILISLFSRSCIAFVGRAGCISILENFIDSKLIDPEESICAMIPTNRLNAARRLLEYYDSKHIRLDISRCVAFATQFKSRRMMELLMEYAHLDPLGYVSLRRAIEIVEISHSVAGAEFLIQYGVSATHQMRHILNCHCFLLNNCCQISRPTH